MILYDTNSDEDININEKILEKFRPNSSLSKTQNGGGSSTPPHLESPVLSNNDDDKDDTTDKDTTDKTETKVEESKNETSSVTEEDLMSIDLTSLKPLMPTNAIQVGEFLDVNITLAVSPSNFTVSFFCHFIIFLQ